MSGILASDVNNPAFAGATNPDSVMVARFYTKAVRNNFESLKQGRPIFADKIYVEYYPAGQRLLVMDVPAYDHHKQRFAVQWAYFQSTQTGGSANVGTPLEQWPILSPADVENLKGAKFTTVDQLAGASDSQIQILGMGLAGMAPHVLRARAQAYLGTAKDTALPQKQAEEIETLKKQVAELLAAKQTVTVVADEPVKPAKRVWTAEEKAAAGERLKKAREAKQNKVT